MCEELPDCAAFEIIDGGEDDMASGGNSLTTPDARLLHERVRQGNRLGGTRHEPCRRCRGQDHRGPGQQHWQRRCRCRLNYLTTTNDGGGVVVVYRVVKDKEARSCKSRERKGRGKRQRRTR